MSDLVSVDMFPHSLLIAGESEWFFFESFVSRTENDKTSKGFYTGLQVLLSTSCLNRYNCYVHIRHSFGNILKIHKIHIRKIVNKDCRGTPKLSSIYNIYQYIHIVFPRFLVIHPLKIGPKTSIPESIFQRFLDFLLGSRQEEQKISLQ